MVLTLGRHKAEFYMYYIVSRDGRHGRAGTAVDRKQEVPVFVSGFLLNQVTQFLYVPKPQMHRCKGISTNPFTGYINLGAGYQPVSNDYLAAFKAGVAYRY